MKTSFILALIGYASRASLSRLGMLVALGCCLVAGPAWAAAVSWGSVYPSVLRDSQGNPLDNSFSMQLGYFNDAFTPGADNTSQWVNNWHTFDQAAYYGPGDVNNSFDSANGYFTRPLIEIGVSGRSASPYAQNNNDANNNFNLKTAYLWTFNSQTPSGTAEWLLVRASTWVFPEYDPNNCCPGVTVQWSVSDLGDATPVWGGQGSKRSDDGYYTDTNVNYSQYTLQTFTVIPEPSSAMLTALGVTFALLRRNRRPMTAMNSKVTLMTAVLAVGIASPCKAERIHWYGPTFKTNVTSTGESMNQEMVFELGLFTDGFVPTAENVADWSTHWLAAQRANYSPEGKFFSATFMVTQTSSQFTGGKPAYIWGFRGGVESGEWILFRKDTWKWPILAADQAAEARNPLSALEWNAAQATAIVGTIQSTSEPFLMKTAAISNAAAPRTSWNEWAQMHMKGEPRNGLTQDADGDGVNNLLEYVFGSLPNKANPPPAMPMELVTVGSEQYMQVTIPRRSDHTANLSVEVSSDLMNWTSGGNSTMTISDSPAGWVVRDRVAHGAENPKRFFRLKAEIPTP